MDPTMGVRFALVLIALAVLWAILDIPRGRK